MKAPTTRVERILGQPDYCRLFVKGTSFLLSKADVLALAVSVQRVLASYEGDALQAQVEGSLKRAGQLPAEGETK